MVSSRKRLRSVVYATLGMDDNAGRGFCDASCDQPAKQPGVIGENRIAIHGRVVSLLEHSLRYHLVSGSLHDPAPVHIATPLAGRGSATLAGGHGGMLRDGVGKHLGFGLVEYPAIGGICAK